MLFFSDGQCSNDEINQFLNNLMKNKMMCDNFEEFQEIDANRTMKKQLSMIHIESGFKCIILVENRIMSELMGGSSKIMRHYMKRPMCKILV